METPGSLLQGRVFTEREEWRGRGLWVGKRGGNKKGRKWRRKNGGRGRGRGTQSAVI